MTDSIRRDPRTVNWVWWSDSSQMSAQLTADMWRIRDATPGSIIWLDPPPRQRNGLSPAWIAASVAVSFLAAFVWVLFR